MTTSLAPQGPADGARRAPSGPEVAIGAATNFFDALGIGSFAPTTALLRRFARLDDALLPGTLNVGHALPTVLQAVLFIHAFPVERTTLVAMILASVVGAWFGAGIVSRLPRRRIQLGMGIALVVMGLMMAATAAALLPGGGSAIGLHGRALAVAIIGNLVLGALMTIGIGLYGPCMVLVYALGMTPTAAFPIMMGSCAALMPVASWRFIKAGRYDRATSLGLTLGGVPAVLIAVYLVGSMPLDAVRILVAAVVLLTGAGLIRAGAQPADG